MRLLSVGVLLFLFLGVFCKKDNLKAQTCPKKVSVQGVAIVTGNEPFTKLILKCNTGTYLIRENDHGKKIRNHHQNQSLEIKGCLFKNEQPAFVPNFLGEIKVTDFRTL